MESEDRSSCLGESNLTSNDRARQWLSVIRDLLSIYPIMSALNLKFFVDRAMKHVDDGHD